VDSKSDINFRVFIIFSIIKTNDMSSYLYYLLGWLDNEENPSEFVKRQRHDVLKEIREKRKLVTCQDCQDIKITLDDKVETQKLSTFLKSYADVAGGKP